MIRLATPITAGAPLTAAESFGLSTLLDLSRLVVFDPPSGADQQDVVALEVIDGAGIGGALGPLLDPSFGIERRAGSIRVPRALLRAITEVAGGGAEQRSSARDRHSRVPSAENPLVAAGRAREPVVSRCGAALRAATIAVAERRPVRTLAPWPNGARWAMALTHDLDVVSLWPAFTALRMAELLRKGALLRMTRVAMAAFGGVIGTPVEGNPVWSGIRHILAAERRAGLPSTWFVIAGARTLGTMRAGDVTYAVRDSRTRYILFSLVENGNEIGLHGSFSTTESEGVFVAERDRLHGALAHHGDEGGTTEAIVGVRQHYLRMHPGATQRAMSTAGFTYDATYGYPDQNGFRLGIADAVPAWDAAADRELSLVEVPLIWMDRAQSKYQGIEDPTRWIDDALALAESCRSVEGLWVGLWHPNLTPALGFPGAPAAYERLLTSLVQHAPYAAQLSEIVAWRGLRRGVRARAIGSDGRVVLDGPTDRPFEVVTEDGSGTRQEALAPR